MVKGKEPFSLSSLFQVLLDSPIGRPSPLSMNSLNNWYFILVSLSIEGHIMPLGAGSLTIHF